MRPKDKERAHQLTERLCTFARDIHALPGIDSTARREAFVGQVIESIRRVEYVRLMRTLDHDASRADPSNDAFDPLIAAILKHREGQVDEAFWLTFLSIHFGKHRTAGWRLVRYVYGQLGCGEKWTWEQANRETAGLREWLHRNEQRLRPDGRFCFGNHRKYESLTPGSKRDTADVFESYIDWVRPFGSHFGLIQHAQKQIGTDPGQLFDYLYRSMRRVISFGRMARFDYLTMLGKLGLAEIEPSIPYLQGATGPLTAARMLFGNGTAGRLNYRELDARIVELGAFLGVGMQAMEDSLCNWQKSPTRFRPFRG